MGSGVFWNVSAAPWATGRNQTYIFHFSAEDINFLLLDGKLTTTNFIYMTFIYMTLIVSTQKVKYFKMWRAHAQKCLNKLFLID